MNEHPRRFADKAARTARETVDKGSAAAAESARDAERSYVAAADGIRDFNVRLAEMAHANTLAAFDFVREISSAKEPSAAASLWSSHLREHFETLTEQCRELTALAQSLANATTEPMTRGLGTPFKGRT
jgi:hypothetical protein